MDTVYIWGLHDLTGHASIAFDNTGYISFHPSLRAPGDLKRVALGERFPPRFSEFDEDLQKYRRPVSQIQIDHLDDEKISYYLRKKADSELPHYSLYDHNCSAVVARIMFAGADAYFDPHRTLHGAWKSLTARFHHNFLNTQSDDRIIEGIRDHLEDCAFVTTRSIRLLNPLARAMYTAFIAVDAATRLLVWTPGAVEELARGFAKYNKSS